MSLTMDISCPRWRSDRIRTVPVVGSAAMESVIRSNKKAEAPEHHRFFENQNCLAGPTPLCPVGMARRGKQGRAQASPIVFIMPF